jgi:hypothetical protein
MNNLTKDKIKHIFAYSADNGELVLQGISFDEYTELENLAIKAIDVDARLNYLEGRHKQLIALEHGGVDNWEGYDDAMHPFFGDLDDDDDFSPEEEKESLNPS